jgi:cytochrome b561
MVANPADANWTKIIAILTLLVIYVTMVYGPIAAWLVEMFPTRIRYTGMSLPYHIRNCWFGRLQSQTGAVTHAVFLFAMIGARLAECSSNLWSWPSSFASRLSPQSAI